MSKNKRLNLKRIRIQNPRKLLLSQGDQLWLKSLGICLDLNTENIIPFLVRQEGRPDMLFSTLETDSGVLWVVEYPELKGVLGCSLFIKQAIKDLEETTKSHLEAMRQCGLTIPEYFNKN